MREMLADSPCSPTQVEVPHDGADDLLTPIGAHTRQLHRDSANDSVAALAGAEQQQQLDQHRASVSSIPGLGTLRGTPQIEDAFHQLQSHAAPVIATPGRTHSSKPGHSAQDQSGSELPCSDRPAEEVELFFHDGTDASDLYVSDAWRTWQRMYSQRLAKKMHRLVCTELDRAEEVLFMMFVAHDANLDGVVRGDEATQLVESLSKELPAVASDVEEGYLAEPDGSISLVKLLTWFGAAEEGYQKTNAGFNASSWAVGLLGSGLFSIDRRLEASSWAELRRAIIGYRRLFGQLRLFKESRAIDIVRRIESERGLAASISEYHNLLAGQFEGDAEHLFELFCEADEGDGELLLIGSEVETLLLLIDPDASHDDLQRYIEEINMEDGHLGFSFLMEWWTQALESSQEASKSLVAEKGPGLIAGIKARHVQRQFTGFFRDTAVQARWKRAEAQGRLPALRQAYCRTFSEYREFKMLRGLRVAEEECAQL